MCVRVCVIFIYFLITQILKNWTIPALLWLLDWHIVAGYISALHPKNEVRVCYFVTHHRPDADAEDKRAETVFSL